MNRELLNELIEVADKSTENFRGEVVIAAIVTAYAKIRAAEITAAGKPEKENFPRDAY